MTDRPQRSLLALALGLLAIIGGIAWLHTASRPSSPTTVLREEHPAPGENAPRHTSIPVLATDAGPDALVVTPAPQPPPPPGQEPDRLDVAPDTSATFLGERISSVPQRPLKVWFSSGVGGMTVVVDPDLPTRELDRLARDIREHGLKADIFHARIFDSEEAATYDRHSDGGALAARHLVAVVTHNASRGLDVVKVRGLEIDLR